MDEKNWSSSQRSGGGYPGSADKFNVDMYQMPDIFEYDRPDRDTLPGIWVKDGWAYFKVPFLWLESECWDDLRVPAQNTRLNPTKSEPAFEEFTDGLYVYKFDTSNADDESVHFVAQMPHTWKQGTNIEPHIHWSPDSTNTGNVRWQFEYIVQDVGGTFASTATSETITAAAGGVALGHQLSSFSAIDGSSLLVSHIIICRLTRLSSSDAADTFTGNACFLEFDFHFQKDSLGSRQQTVK